jgi:hypothetical protein
LVVVVLLLLLLILCFGWRKLIKSRTLNVIAGWLE